MRTVLALLSLAAALLLPGQASAQSACQYITYGAVLTPAQWNSCFSAKQDALGYVPLNKAGDVMLGKLVLPSSSASLAGLNLPQGVAPASPVNGDVWTTSSGLFARINGVTVGPMAQSYTFIASAPLQVSTSFPASVTYALSIDSNFAVVAGALALQQVNAGFLLANATNASAEPTGVSWNSFANQAIGGTNGMLPYRTGGAWGTVSTGTSGATIPLLNAANTWSLSQTFSSGIATDSITVGAVAGGNKGSGSVNLIALYDNNLLILDSSGNLTATNVTSAGNVTAATAGSIGWTSRSIMQSPADGNILLLNNAGTAFTALQFGGTTASFPELKRVSAALAFRFADDSADASFTAATGTFSGSVNWPGTSGGIPYFASATTTASSGVLTANRLVLGGGAGAAPTVLGSLGTTTTVLHGNAAGAPSFAAVSLTADVSGTLPVGSGGTGTTTSTGTGSVVLSATPTFTGSPVLATPSATTLIVGNSTTLPASDTVVITTDATTLPAAGVQLHIGSAAGAQIELDPVAAQGTLTIRRANTSHASPSALASGDLVFNLTGAGYDGSAYSVAAFALRSFAAPSGGNWTASDHGMYATVTTTPSGSITAAEAARFQPSGGLSVGTTTDPGIGSLQLNAQMFLPNITTSSAAQNGTVCWTTGTGKFTVDTTVGCLTSSRKFKHHIQPLTDRDALATVMALRPVRFWYNDQGMAAGEQVGFIAEDTDEVDPRLVARDQRGDIRTVRYGQLTADLVAVVQEQQRQINALKRMPR